jgi:hypothetical protein
MGKFDNQHNISMIHGMKEEIQLIIEMRWRCSPSSTQLLHYFLYLIYLMFLLPNGGHTGVIISQ